MTAMTCCCLSVVTIMGSLLVLAYSAMLPTMVGDVLVKSDSHSAMKLTKSLLLVHSVCLLNFSFARKVLNPLLSAVESANR